MKPLKEIIKTKQFWLCGLAVLFSVVGVPILINESYIPSGGYITKWGAADVLSYYGTLLGALATIIALYFTIKSTRTQITSERYISIKREKWGEIERLFRTAISVAQPVTLFDIYISGLSKESIEGCTDLQKYNYNVKAAIDDILGMVEEADEQKVHDLLEKLKKVAKRVEALSNEYFDLLMAFRASKETLTDDNKLLITAALLEDQKKITAKVNKLHDGEYQELLMLKKQCFGEIYREIDEEARRILYSNK